MRRQPPKLAQTSRQWLLVVLRTITSVFLCGALALIQTRGSANDIHLAWFQPGLAAVGIYLALALTFYRIRAGGLAAAFNAAAQVATDLALAICLTLITGVNASPFSFLFIIAIINSAFLGGLHFPLTVATLSAALWGGLITLQHTELLAEFMPQQAYGGPLLAAETLLAVRLDRILINTGACYLVAFLSGHLAGQLALSRRALVTSQVSLGRLADLNELIIQSVDVGLITTSQDGMILTVNRPGLRILGLTLEKMIGRPWPLLLPEPARRAVPLGGRIGTAAPTGGLRFKYTRKSDDRELTLELNALALASSGGESWGRLFMLKDLTSLIKMEEAVRKAERLAAVGEMAAGLAHELRTPLASLTGAWHMLAEDEEAAEPSYQKRLAGIISREADRLVRLTNDFLSFARPSKGSPSLFDPSALAADQLHIFTQTPRPGLQVECRLQPVPPAFFDRDHFCQIFWNLLANAVEAGARQDHLRLLVETGLTSEWPGYIVFKVSNDGPPIPAADLPRLFEPFFTTKPTGSGLGLATVNRLLQEGGGHIDVGFNPPDLTTFTVHLPTAAPAD